ncbi:MAG: C69 family dipeptidase, partial [Lactobacillus helveticus]
LDTPSVYRDTKEHFDIKNMYWLTQAIATIVDEHPFRYSASVEELQMKLQKANDQTAKAAYDAAMKCFGDCVETGALQIKLNY